MYTFLIVLHVIVCAFLILVVLLQAGKGGGMGIAFGGGGSQTVFGSSGAGNFLTRLTAICAVVFFANSLLLAWMSSRSDVSRLQSLSQRKAAEKAQQQAATDKIAKDLEKVRQEMEKNRAASSSPGAVPAPAPGATPAPGIPAPGGTPAPAPSGTSPAPTGSAPPAAPAQPSPQNNPPPTAPTP
jgi:preprotein translocase subunit SecG